MFYDPPIVRLHLSSGLYIRSDGLFSRTENGPFERGYLKPTVAKSRKGTKQKLYYQTFTNRWWYIHRLVADCFCENPCPKEFWVVDHISGEQENNKSSNLRWCTQALNGLNRLDAKNYSYHKRWKKFLVSVVVNGKKMMGGSYKTEDKAALAAKLFKADLFRALYKSYVKNETETTRTCELVHGLLTHSSVVPELHHTGDSWTCRVRRPRFVVCC